MRKMSGLFYVYRPNWRNWSVGFVFGHKWVLFQFGPFAIDCNWSDNIFD
jgi:hypothetical protein